ncbi:MAG: hypothetical protein ACI90U_000027 [Pseudomonadales bacterium]|jgi:hypothetical protein
MPMSWLYQPQHRAFIYTSKLRRQLLCCRFYFYCASRRLLIIPLSSGWFFPSTGFRAQHINSLRCNNSLPATLKQIKFAIAAPVAKANEHSLGCRFEFFLTGHGLSL